MADETNKELKENQAAVEVVPFSDVNADSVSKIDSYEHKGKKVVRLVAPNGLHLEVVPAMTNKGPRFFMYLDKKLLKSETGLEFFDISELDKRVSGLGKQGISLKDLGDFVSKLEAIDHHMKSNSKTTAEECSVSEGEHDFYESADILKHVNESVDKSFADNSNIPVPDKDKTMEEENKEPVVEGQYLQSGLSTREAPIPFTQDPNLEGVPDYLDDEEKAGKLQKLSKQTGSISGTGVDGGGEAMSESIIEQFKEGDLVCIDRIKDVEWLVESISTNPDKMVVRNGKKKKIISPSTSFVELAEGESVHRERQLENLDALKEAYMKMEFEENKRALKANWCTYEEGEATEKSKNTLPILEKNDMYSFIKSNDLHKTDEVAAYQSICEKYGNDIAEVEKIMEDVKLSESNESIDSMYNFNAVPFEENNIGLSTTLEQAWAEMQKKELEETAKLSDEEPGKNGGGLGPLKINL